MVDDDVARAERVDRIGVGRLGREDADIAQDHIVRVVGHDLPEAGVLHRHALHAHVLGMVEDHAHRPRMVIAQHAGVPRANDIVPPDFAVAVDRALARDRDILRVHRAHQRLHGLVARKRHRGIILPVGRTQQHRALGDIQGNVALQQHRPGQKCSAAQRHRAAARRWRSRQWLPGSPWCPWLRHPPSPHRCARRTPCPLRPTQRRSATTTPHPPRLISFRQQSSSRLLARKHTRSILVPSPCDCSYTLSTEGHGGWICEG